MTADDYVSEASAKSGPVAMLLTQKQTNSDLALEAGKLQNGIARLVLSLVETIILVLERQAFKRFNSGTLTDDQIDQLGVAFIEMKERMQEISQQFGYTPSSLQLGLSSNDTSAPNFGAVSLADLLSKLIEKEAVVSGDIRLAVAGVDLVTLNILASISSSPVPPVVSLAKVEDLKND